MKKILIIAGCIGLLAASALADDHIVATPTEHTVLTADQFDNAIREAVVSTNLATAQREHDLFGEPTLQRLQFDPTIAVELTLTAGESIYCTPADSYGVQPCVVMRL